MKNIKVNFKSLPERTADAIGEMLHTENYKTNQRLPNELEMAEMFEVSRTTIRQAEKILAEKGILTIQRGVGTFVSENLGIQDDPLGLSFMYDKEKLDHDLLELRVLIEPKTAALAAQNASRRDISLLHQLLDEMETLVASGQPYLQKDMEFHQAIANCSGNVVIHNLIPYIHQMQVLHESLSTKRHNDQTVAEHRMILRAIEEKRGADAYDAMHRHLSNIIDPQ